MSTIDLNNPPPNHNYKVSVDREESASERGVRLFKDVVLFMLAISLVATIAWIAVHTLNSSTTSADDKKWAMSILTAAAGGMIGYLVKK